MKKRPLLMIPGPIEFDPEVLHACGAPTVSHVSAEFIDTFGRCLERMRTVWGAPNGQPILLAGSGTLAMDTAGANLIEPGDRALVLSTGVFGDRYADLLSRYGAQVMVVGAPLGETIDFSEVDTVLKNGCFKLMTATHVDTSTGVRIDAERFGELARAHGVLSILDGVCSVAGEPIRQDAWGIDVVLTASQKAIGVPPGLALLVVSEAALAAFESRQSATTNYYADWGQWIPIMHAYEERRPSYFGTPAVNLVAALDVGLEQILTEGLRQREDRHRRIGSACRAALTALGLEVVPTSEDHAANTLSAPRCPPGIRCANLLTAVREAGVTFAGGLHPEIRTSSFRIGHMGSVRETDVLTAVAALETGLLACKAPVQPGVGVAAAQRVLTAGS